MTGGPGGVYRAKVTRVSGGRPYVTIPRLGGSHEYGPLDILQGVWTAGLTTATAPIPPHTHVINPVSDHDHAGVALPTHQHSTETPRSAGTPDVDHAGGHGHTTGAAVGDPHDHPIPDPPLEPGDRVLVAFIESKRDDPVILGRLT